MRPGEWFKQKLESLKEDFDFRLETLILDITEQICKRMKKKVINRTRLRELLNVSPPAVSKILNGNSNFTLKTLLSMSDALGLDLKIDFVEKSSVSYEACDSHQFHEPTCYYDDSRYLAPATFASTSDEINITATPLKRKAFVPLTAAHEVIPIGISSEWRQAA
ncbi:MAG TPA: XRE family transcriptional regulator [Deltaproteobacteria bacterium]|nr:XRE family transcriptional regulator [Deltaproteobacteria bacterium]HIJ39602.1 XRE family transcriptional regulator [Deltaproteobacteria bacterium]